MDEQIKTHPHFQNFISVSLGFAYVGKTLEPYTRAGLQTVHQEGYKRFAGLSPCSERCSDQYGRDLSRWCQTCKTWQKYLLQKHRGVRVRWENTESWRWITEYETIAETFLPPNWSGSDTKLDDFATACYVWSNCKEFYLGKHMIHTLRTLRNKYVGHNPDMKVTESDKAKVFNELKSLLCSNEVQTHINVTKCKLELDNLAKPDEIAAFIKRKDDSMNRLFKDINTIGSAQTSLAICVNHIFTLLNTQNKYMLELRNENENNTRRRSFKAPSLKSMSTVLVFIVTMMLVISLVQYPQYEDCLSEMYSYPFPQDMPLMPYLKEHESLIGREWLLDEIKTLIFQSNSLSKGVLLTADMGYGKSATVKHLLCSKKDKKGHGITERIVAFHICKFDVPSTRDAGRFVHRLIGFLATNIPEFGGIISQLPDSALIHDRDKCRKEIVACFDQGILHPLNELKSKTGFPLIIIIDALDECLNDRTTNNELFYLLLTRYRKMPTWLKFILTSRNITIAHEFHSLDKLHLMALDNRNLADISAYFTYKTSVSSGIGSNRDDVDTLFNQSEGNFLFAVKLIDYIFANQYVTKDIFPKTLSDIYEMEFERHFSIDVNFKIAKIILEIVVASLQPLRINDVEAVLNYTNPAALNIFSDIFEKLTFCFRSVDELTLVHKSLHSWLISKDNTRFHISVENGHALLSEYLLGQLGRRHIHDLVDIVIHVANSKRFVLKKAFESSNVSANITKSSIHRLIWKTDSTDALKLLLKLNVTVDALNEGNVTPAFVAAARGHLNQLKILKSRGADLNFIVNSAYLITSPEQINLIKHDYYFGYGLIHIAVNFGNVNIVEYLINQNKSISHTRNGLRMTVVEMACENGHLVILKLVGKYDYKFGYCVYYAAKNGHTHILRYLVEVGVNTSCVSSFESEDALANITNVDFSKTVVRFGSNVSYPCYEMYDLWWIVLQESALHAAVGAKFSETAEFLVTNYPHLAECVDANGMTPFLLSVAVNETKTFELLIDRISRDKCSYASNLTRNNINVKPMACPLGASYLHLIASYGRNNLIRILRRQRIQIVWFIKDAYSVTPLHYAACSNNIIFLIITRDFSDIRSSNGSSPFHSAALCGSLRSILAMTADKSVPNLKDLHNKTILHYLVSREFNGNPAKNDIAEQNHYAGFLYYIINNTTIVLDAIDSNGRNIVHYALKNGHFLIIQYLSAYNNDLLATMLEQIDINGKSPVKYATDTLKSYFHKDQSMNVPKNCSFYDIFYVHCGTWDNLKNYVTSMELSLLEVMFSLKADWHKHFLSIFQDLVETSPYLTTAVLVKLNRPALATIKSRLIQSIRESPSQYSTYAIARHRPKLFSTCGKPVEESPLHLMAYRSKNIKALHDIEFYKLAFGNSIDTKALSCADSVGYNSFHYALLAGNIRMARMLFDIGVQIANTKIKIQDIPWMMLLGRKHSFHSKDFYCSDQFICMDDLLYKTFSKFGDKFKFSEICDENRYQLSLVHVVGASGLRRTLKILGDIFGLGVIKCQNRDGISPLYLGDLLNPNHWREILETSETDTPRSATEQILLLFLLNDYTFQNNCVMSTRRYRTLSVHKYNVWYKRYKTKILEHNLIHPYSSVHSFLRLFNDASSFDERFQNALINKNNIEMNSLLIEVINSIGYFNKTLRLFNKHYNYRALKHLRTLQRNSLNCSLNDYKLGIPCFKIYIEFEHMHRKVIATTKDVWVKMSLYFMKINKNYISQDFSYFKKSIERQTCLDTFKQHFKKSFEDMILEHSYLHILRKTVQYQYIKDKFVLEYELYQFYMMDTLLDVAKPFVDLIKLSQKP